MGVKLIGVKLTDVKYIYYFRKSKLTPVKLMPVKFMGVICVGTGTWVHGYIVLIG